MCSCVMRAFNSVSKLQPLVSLRPLHSRRIVSTLTVRNTILDSSEVPGTIWKSWSVCMENSVRSLMNLKLFLFYFINFAFSGPYICE